MHSEQERGKEETMYTRIDRKVWMTEINVVHLYIKTRTR